MNSRAMDERQPAESQRPAFEQVQLSLSRALGAVGFTLGHYQRSFVQRRVAQCMRHSGTDLIDEYARRLVRDTGEARRLGQSLQRPMVSLFRQPDSQAAVSALLTDLCLEAPPAQIWVPGCGAGEDVFTVARLALEVLESAPGAAEGFTVYGSDTETEALAAARCGVLSDKVLELIPSALRPRYLAGTAAERRVAPVLLRHSVFLLHDLTTPAPLFDLDLICARNLFANLEPSTLHRVLDSMHAALRPGGILMLEGADLAGHDDLFVQDADMPAVYRRVSRPVRKVGTVSPLASKGDLQPGIYRAAFCGASRAALLLDQNFDVCDLNTGAAQVLLPMTHHTVLESGLAALVASTDRARVTEMLLTLGGLGRAQQAVTLQNGTAVILSLSRLGDTGDVRYLAELVVGDGGAQPAARLAEQAARTETALRALNEGLIVLDRTGAVVEFNLTAERMTGWTRSEALGQPHVRVFRLGSPVGTPTTEGLVERAIAGRTINAERDDLYLQHRDGRRHALTLRVKSVPAGGAVLVFDDVSEMNLLTEELAYRATHDALTGLLNREEFESRCRAALSEAKRGGEPTVLCYIDIDQFKVINDTLGHVAGDELLHELAGELRSRLTERDVLARLGGDEFGVLLAGHPADGGRAIVTSLIDTARSFRFVWNGLNYAVTISIGSAPIDGSTENITRVMSMADAACFVAKDAGRDRACFAGDDDELSRRYIEMSLVGKIGKALDEGRFILHYEDVVRTGDLDRVVYRELLVRMVDDDGSLQAPSGFIQAAERYFLMNAIDRWVLHEAFRGIAKLPVDNVIYAVNLSGQSLGDEQFLDFVLNELETSGVDPERICFEITETAAVSRLSEAVRFIDRVSGFGCRFALDDFGSGMASFSYLKNFRVHFLKIDGSFVRAMLGSRADRGMVESINRIGHELGLRTIAEHVESAALLQPLRDLGVDWVQGRAIAYSRPFDTLMR